MSIETTETVEVVASPSENPVGSIIAVHELKGRFTGEPRHAFYSSVPTDDAKLFKRFWFRAPAE